MEILDSCPYSPFLVAIIVPIIIFFRFIFIPILGFGNAVYSGDKSNFGA